MRILIFMGSPNYHGNTAATTRFFMDELKNQGAEVDYVEVYKKNIGPCVACKKCAYMPENPHCALDDDLNEMVDKVMAADSVVFASPIYAFYCTAPIKALQDRIIYCMNKYFGKGGRKSYWTGKTVSMLITCGYKTEYAALPFEEGMKRFARHCGIKYIEGFKPTTTDKGSHAPFLDETNQREAREFAMRLLSEIQ